MSSKTGRAAAVPRPKEAQAGDFDCLAGGGEACKLARSIDWAGTPIGPVEGWSQALRSTASLVLHNHSGMLLWWGPEFVQIYNDAYRSVLGDKHPRAMGQRFRDCWSEVFHILGPMAERPFRGGPAATSDDIAVPIHRKVAREEAHFRLAYSPVPDKTVQPTGIGGVLATVTEITEQAYADRQLQTLRELGARSAAHGTTAEQACAVAAATLEENAWDVPFALFYLLDEHGGRARLTASAGFDKRLLERVAPLEVDLSAAADPGLWPILQVAKERRVELVTSLSTPPEALPLSPWSERPTSAIALPLASPEQAHVYGVLICGVSPHRLLDAGYRTFFELAGAQIVTAIRNARALEEERKRAEALSQIDRAKTAFFSNVSHEFRTPLTLLLGPVEEASSNPSTPAAVRAQLELAHRNALRLQKLVNSLLDFSRIEARRVQASYAPSDLGALTRDLASTFRSAMERAGLDFTVECDDLVEPVFVDEEMWEKIVLNLLSNAFKFTLQGRVAVRLRREAADAVLEVSDTGVGVPEHEVPRLFERFHRVEGTTGRTREGSGIGLALVQELVKLHGGKVSVASELGRGTTFRVAVPFGSTHLPAERIKAPRVLASTAVGAQAFVQEALRWIPATADDMASTLPAAVEDPMGSRRFVRAAGARILLADDNADMRAYVADLLQPTYIVEAVSDGEEALQAARRTMPDLIVSDIMMSRTDGLTLLKTLRADEQLREIPVVLLSARAGEEARIEGLDAGADDYLVKPFSSREFLARIGALIELTRMRQESEERFHALVSATSEVIYRMSPDWTEMRFLKGRNFIADTDDPSRSWLDKYIYPDDQPRVMATVREAVRTKSVYYLEHRVRRVDGTIGWTESRAIAVKDANGNILEWFGAASDVTERKATEQALREREEQLRLATEAAEVGLWDVDLVADTLFWPPRVKAMFGISPEVSVSMADFYAGLHPEDRQRTSEAFAAALDPERRALYDVEYRTVGKEDRLVRWVAAKGRGIFDSSGRCVRVIGTAIDITASKRAEERLREETRVQEVLGRMSDALVAAQLDIGRVVRIAIDAATELSGAAFGAFFYNMQDEKGGWSRLYTLSGLPREAFARFPQPRNTEVFGPTFRGEGIVRSADITADPRYGRNAPHRGMPAGHLPVRSYLAVPVKTSTGQVLGGLFFGHPEPGIFDERAERLVLAIAAQAAVAFDNARLHQASQREIEERRRAEEALSEADRRKNEFLAMLAHELRNPLAPIATASELLTRTSRDDTYAQTAVGMIKRQVSQLTRLVDDLLDVARITQGRIQLKKRPIDLAAVVTQAVETLEPQLREKKHKLSVLASSYEHLYVMGDFARLVQCVGNILANAVKYTESGGEISVRTGAEDGSAFIGVSDTGMGIATELLPRVFDLFVQSERTLDRSQGGLGIGLALVKRLVQMHEGEVRVRSEGPGRGSTFEIRLPRIARPTAAGRDAQPFKAEPRRVLIVDDNADAANSLAMLLAFQGHETQVAYGAREAITCVEAFRPEVALLDIGLPEMNGYELAKRLRALPQMKGLRLIAVTGYGQAEDQQRALNSGFDAHVVKPVDLAALERALAGVSDTRSTESG